MTPRPRIGLFGPYSSKNLGDTATQMAVMQNLRERLRDPHIIGICFDPMDGAKTHGIDTADMTGSSGRIVTPGHADQSSAGEPGHPFPRSRRFLPALAAEFIEKLASIWNIARIIRRIDVLIISGGGQLDDFWGGAWARPYELLVWSVLCRCLGRKIALFGTGVDNLTTPLGKWMVTRAVKLSHYRMYRDTQTLRFVADAGIHAPGTVGPDPAFSLGFTGSADPSRKRPYVIVCPIAESAWKREAERTYQDYLEALQEVIVALARKGIRVALSNSQSGMDMPVLEAIASRARLALGSDANPIEVIPSFTVRDFCALAAKADLVVASRLHGVILPMMVGTPVVAVSYMPKVSLLMSDAGMPDACVQLQDVSTAKLLTMITDALSDADSSRERIATLNARYRAELSRHYDDMLWVLGLKDAASGRSES